MIELFDLAGADPAVRFSPYCWRTRMALAHKGLDVTTIPWRFTDKDAIAFSGQGRVPVIRDGDTVVWDSWAIARHLEATYPDRPTLFGGAAGEAHARFINSWADGVLLPGIARFIVGDVFAVIGEEDKSYFRRTREERFGKRIEDIQVGREAALPAFRQSLAPLRLTLKAQPFLGGAGPMYGDHVVFGNFQWARVTSAFQLLDRDDEVAVWLERMLDLYGGLARATPLACP